MLIGKDYKITADEMNIILYKQKTYTQGKKVGQKFWEVYGYYPTIKGAIKGLAKDQIHETKLEDLKTICSKIDDLYALIKNLDIKEIDFSGSRNDGHDL